MRAMEVEHADLALSIAEENEVLAEQPDLHRPVLDVVAELDRPPIAAQHLAARRARADLGHQPIFALAQHVVLVP